MDTIERDAAINAVFEAIADGKSVYKALSHLPSAEDDKSKWVESGYPTRPYKCNACGFSFDVDTFMGEPIWNYCPNCGARMVE